MSTVSNSRRPKSPRPKPDPFRYGWRDVTVKAPDGTESIDQVPLTLEDVLFPEEGDVIVQTTGHNRDVNYLADVFGAQLAENSEAVVISDCLVDWNLAGVRPMCPDIAVFFGMKRYEDWDTFDVKAEGAKPELVTEVTSRSTRKNDLGPKFELYHRAKVPLYLIADARGRGRRRRIQLIGHQYARRGYRPMKLDDEGRIHLAVVGVKLGVAHDPRGGFDRLVCFDAVTGEELGDYAAVTEGQDRAKARAEAEAQARAAAEIRSAAVRAETTRRSPAPRPRRESASWRPS